MKADGVETGLLGGQALHREPVAAVCISRSSMYIL
jgi:hypothetical protein